MIEDRAESIVKILQRALADDSRTYTDRMISVMIQGRVFNNLLAEQGLRAHKMLELLAKKESPAGATAEEMDYLEQRQEAWDEVYRRGSF